MLNKLHFRVSLIIKAIAAFILFYMGRHVAKIAEEIGDIVKANEAVKQLSEPYNNIMVREIADRFPYIALGFYLIAILLIVSIAYEVFKKEIGEHKNEN